MLKSAGNSDLFCKRCGVTYNQDDDTARRKHRLSVPEETEPSVSIIQYDFNKDVEIRHPKELRGGIAELQKRGLRITYFEDSPIRKICYCSNENCSWKTKENVIPVSINQPSTS